MSKSTWYFIAFILMTALVIVLNEIGLGAISLLLLLPTCLLMSKAIEKENDQ